MKTNYLKITAALLAAISISFSACNDDDDDDDDKNKNTITDNITGNTTWKSGETYVLGSRIAVESGATLTIEAGAVIKGEAGTGANATALVVAKGGTLNAKGTKSSPIIFTSIADEIEPGSIVSSNALEPKLSGLWGGLIVLGDASISADAEAVQIEGIPASDANGLYGGSTDDDNSGTIQYISIRHGGSNIGEGNEINGITLGGVGTGTTIDHIEVVGNQDDGIECFGGTVDVSHILVWNQGDDAFDMDQAYQGTIDNFIYIGGETSDHGMELDGPEGSATGAYTLTNGSLKGWNDEGEDGGEMVDLRDAPEATIKNCYFFNFSVGADIELDDDDVAAKYEAGKIVFENLEFNFALKDDDGADVQTNDDVDWSDVFVDKGDDASDAFTAGTTPSDFATKTSSPTVGATKSEFTGWTWADKDGELADF